ncbi:MAG: c-type cytochrome, partial [Rhizobiales bacterium]|nr:c-type cytochrome [Hyphomicrobiales bacterium]
MVKKGAVIYAEYCASCHGADLEGQPNWQSPDADGKMPAPPHDQRGHTWHHS